MLEWIKQMSPLLQLGISVCTLLIWVIYAQLLYAGFLRQRRAALIINRGGSKNIDALCLISNMSAEAIFIQYILVELRTTTHCLTMDVTDKEMRKPDATSDDSQDEEQGSSRSHSIERLLTESSHQGPLDSSHYLHIGSFRDLLRRLERHTDRQHLFKQEDDAAPSSLTIRLIASYGPENRPIGAERTFDLQQGEHEIMLQPRTWNTVRLTSFRQRWRLRRTIRHYLERAANGDDSSVHVEPLGSDPADR